MTLQQEDFRIIGEVIDAMADRAAKESDQINIAIERFSGAVDRLVTWLPADLRDGALEQARAHGYCTREQIERLRQEITTRH